MWAALRYVLAAAAVGLALFGMVSRPAPDLRLAAPRLPDPDLPPGFETVYAATAPQGRVGAPAIIAGGPEGDAALLWLQGGRVLGVDLPDGGAPRAVLEPASVSQDTRPPHTVRTLGPATGDGAGGVLAATGLLGLPQGASVLHMPTRQGRITQARRLDLSPLLGRGHMLAGPVVALEGGGHLLPARSTLGRAGAVVAHLDASGRVRGLADLRGAPGGAALSVVPLGARRAVALFGQPGSGAVLASWSEDGGARWSAPAALDLPSPVAGVAAVRLSDGRLLMALGAAPGAAQPALGLLLSADQGRTWQRGPVLGGDLRAPALAVLGGGRIALAHAAAGGAGVAVHLFTEGWAVQR